VSTTEENKALARRVIEEALPRATRGEEAILHQYFHDDHVTHTKVHHDDIAPGVEGLKSEMRELGKAVPDVKPEIHHVIAEGNLVMLHYTLRGSHQGHVRHRHVDGHIKPTGRQQAASGISLFRVKDGKIVEHWKYDNLVDTMIEAGILSVQRAGTEA
jgi:predicted SnoaL-like aldol condensation-catalyzing enzyme